MRKIVEFSPMSDIDAERVQLTRWGSSTISLPFWVENIQDLSWSFNRACDSTDRLWVYDLGYRYGLVSAMS